MLGHLSTYLASWDVSTGVSNLLQPPQAEVVLGQLSMYLASWPAPTLTYTYTFFYTCTFIYTHLRVYIRIPYPGYYTITYKYIFDDERTHIYSTSTPICTSMGTSTCLRQHRTQEIMRSSHGLSGLFLTYLIKEEISSYIHTCYIIMLFTKWLANNYS